MKPNEIETIQFLRTLLRFKPGVLDSGRNDPGWCCVENSVASALAFSLLKIKCSLCSGVLFLGPLEKSKILNVFPHDFLLVKEPLGIFDSSVTTSLIEGIPVAFAEKYSDLEVAFMERKPSIEDFLKELSRSKKSLLALYSAKSLDTPNKLMVEWESKSPLGNWIMANFGTQKGLWGKIVWLAAQTYAGNPIFEYTSLDRLTLWKEIISTPDRDEMILRSLAELYGS